MLNYLIQISSPSRSPTSSSSSSSLMGILSLLVEFLNISSGAIAPLLKFTIDWAQLFIILSYSCLTPSIISSFFLSSSCNCAILFFLSIVTISRSHSNFIYSSQPRIHTCGTASSFFIEYSLIFTNKQESNYIFFIVFIVFLFPVFFFYRISL